MSIEELYDKYQTTLKLFYNYAKDNQLHRHGKRSLIEKELQKLYYTVKENLNLHSQLVQSARRDVVNDIMSWLKTGGEYPKLSKKPVTLVYNRSYRLFEQGREFKLWAKICGVAYPLELGDRQLELIRRAKKIGEAKLFKRDGKWYLNVSIEIQESKPIKPKGILGVDLGLKNSAVITGSKPIFIKHRHLLYKVTRYWKQIDKLKSKLPKGQRTSRRIKRLWRKIARINNFIAHDTSAKIVRLAVQSRKAIALEKLEVPNNGYNRVWSRRLSNWVRGKIIRYVQYKARLNGIPVILVNPAYSSRKCHVCGRDGERLSSIFKCKVCGRTYNADFNASVNIARRAMSLLAGACNPPSVGLRDDGRKLPTFSGE
ncbi:MAG: transposase [Thermoproteales archaeon]|nr:transposase [Thermoproteales archaeon]